MFRNSSLRRVDSELRSFMASVQHLRSSHLRWSHRCRRPCKFESLAFARLVVVARFAFAQSMELKQSTHFCCESLTFGPTDVKWAKWRCIENINYFCCQMTLVLFQLHCFLAFIDGQILLFVQATIREAVFLILVLRSQIGRLPLLRCWRRRRRRRSRRKQGIAQTRSNFNSFTLLTLFILK